MNDFDHHDKDLFVNTASIQYFIRSVAQSQRWVFHSINHKCELNIQHEIQSITIIANVRHMMILYQNLKWLGSF